MKADEFYALVEKRKKEKKDTWGSTSGVYYNPAAITQSLLSTPSNLSSRTTDIAPTKSSSGNDFLDLVEKRRAERRKEEESVLLARKEGAKKKTESATVDDDIAPVFKPTAKDEESAELLSGMTPTQKMYHLRSGGSVDTSTSWGDKVAAVTKLILEGKDTDYTQTDTLLKQLQAQQERYKLEDVNSDSEQTELHNYYNQLWTTKYQDVLSKTKMDGQSHSVAEELKIISELSGDEKETRKEAVIKKMEELGIPAENYALFTDDKNFTLGNFGNWLGASIETGLNTLWSQYASTGNTIFGNILEGIGWENNPFAVADKFYEGQVAKSKSNLDIYADRLGGGGWNTASEFATATVAALPEAIMWYWSAASKAGTVLTTSAELAKNAAMQASNFLQKAGLTASKMAQNPKYWMSFLKTFGTDYEESKEKGMDDSKAVLAATTKSLLNAVWENGLAGDSGIQGLGDDLMGGDKNKLWAWIESSVEEGLEEGLQKFTSETIDYVAGDRKTDIYNPLEYLKEIAMGTGVGALLGGGQIAVDTARNSYYQHQVNKLTADEQTVVNKVVEEYVAEQEKEGKKLTAAEKATFKKNTEERLRKGYITVEKIEEILGGEDYSNFKAEKDAFLQSEDFLAYHNATQEKTKLADLEKQLEDLKNAPNTVGNSKAYEALQSKIEDIKEGRTENELLTKMQPSRARVIALENAMRTKVRDRVKGTRLAESYQELERRNQKPNLDPEKYTNETAKATVQNIKDSGLGDGTNEFADYVDYVANYAAKTGKVVKLMTDQQMKDAGIWSKDKNGKPVGITHGALTPDGTIVLNYNSDRNLHWTVGHEIGHVIEKTKHSKALRTALFNHMIAKEGVDAFNKRLEETKENYKDRTDTTPEIELANDLLGEYVFSDYEFVSNLAKANRTVFDKALDTIKQLYKMAVAGSKQQRELEKAKLLFQMALEEVGNSTEKSTDGDKFSLENGRKSKYNKRKKSWYSQAETEFMSWQSGSAKVGDVKRFVRNGKAHYYEKTETGCVELSRSQFNERNGANVENFDRRAERRLGTTFDYDESAERGTLGHSDEYRDTSRNAAVFGETISGKLRNDTAGSVPSASRYDSGDDVEQTKYDDEASGEPGASFVTFSNDYQYFRNRLKEGDVGEEADSNVKFSMSKDSDGKELSKAQADFFRDSKVRDENGNLKPVYHGTYEDFSVFDISKTSVTNAFGSGHYFTSKQSDAQNNYASSEGADVRTKIESLAWQYFEDMGYSETDYESNDYVEEWNEAYDKAEAFYKSGKVMQVYLNITNPLYAGRHGELYNSAGEEVTARSAEMLKELGYDGIIDYGVSDRFGRFQDLDEDTAHYVVFDSSQIKLTDNQSPTSSQDIRFSMSKTVEQTKDLVALHNLTAEKLLKSLELGGLPMPSIAITKADIPHDNFGEITLIMGKDTIDPKANKKNVVYSADAWTPTFPRVEYETDDNVERQINKRLLDLASKVEDVFKHDIDMMRYSHEDNLNRNGGEEGYIQYAMEKYGLKAAYLEDQGKHIEKVTEQVLEEKKYNTANEAKYQAIADILGVSSASELGKLSFKDAAEQYGEQLEAIYPGITKTTMRMSNLFRQVMAYMEDKGGEPVYRTVTDESAMRKAVDYAIDMEGFEAWTRELFAGIVKDKGIYNNKDLFTPSGNRKSFKQTHLPFTLENIVKAMASQNNGNTKNVSGFNGIKTLRAGTAERFKSIAAMHERKGRLQHLTQEEADQINDDLSKRLYNIMETIDNENGNKGSSNSFIRLDSIGETLMEISESGKYNVADIQGVFAQYDRTISDDLAADIKQLLFDVTQMPVNIYEAKPERAVTFDEVGVFVIPRNADIKLKQELLNRGYAIAEYDPDVEGDRNKVVNQFEEYKFSLSDASEQAPRERGAFNERWSDFGRTDPLDDIAPVREDIAPVSESVTAQEDARELFPDDNNSIDRELVELLEQKEELEGQMQKTLDAEDYDAFTAVSDEYNSLMSRLDELENEAADMDADRISSLEDADVPPVREMEWLDRADAVTLTKDNMADIARDLRERLGLTGKQMYDVYKLVEEYSQDEYPSVSRLYEAIKEKFGTYTESEKADESVRDAKKYLRNTRISVDDYIQSEIADYADFRRRNRGKIRFSNDGLPVDVAYHELNSMYPHLFPESIIAPTDQFLKMVEVANMDGILKNEVQISDDVLWGVANDLAEYVGDIRYMQKEANAERLATESFDSLMQEADDIAPIADDIAPKAVEEAPVIKEAPIKTEAPKEIKTAQDKLDAKISKTQTELDNNRQLREQSSAEYDKQIAEQQQKYDSLKNKNTLAANDILRRIERLKRLKATNDANYEKRISDLEARVEKMSSPEYRTAEQRRSKMEQYTEMWKNMIGDTSTWKDLAMGISYKTKTMRRFLRSVVRGADGKANIALADQIYDELETKYDHNEAQLKQESVKLKEVFKKLNLNHAEDTYAHMLGELRHNPQTTLTEDVVKEFYDKHKSKINKNKVERAIAEARSTFDSLLIRVNNVLREQGMKEIPFRKGYFPHFTNPKQGWLAKLLNWKTIDTEIPTSIAGLTEQFEPQRSWQGFNKQREGDTTDYSLYQGLDTYIHGALDWIYHIEDLQKRRSLENYIRYIHSEEGVKAKIEEIKANEYYDADEAQKQIELALAEAKNPLNNLVTELRARTNTLANKKASMDRGMEEATNRKIYSVMTNLNNRINANMVVGSFSSAFTNFIPMVQSWHQVSPWFTVRGLGDMVRNAVKDDGMAAKSDFLTNRLVEEEKLYQTGWDKVADKAAFMMNVIDSITSQTVWRSKYLQNIKEGMSESQAIKDADQFAKNLMAGRSRGNAPSIFDAKNPLIKIATAFQLEVANQYGYMFEDVPQDSKSPLRLVKGYTTAILGAYMYNALYSSLVGRDAAFDPMSIIEDLLRDLGIGDDDDDDEEVNVGEVLLNLGENIVQELPYVGGLFGGGRVPMSSALPYSSDSSPFESLVSDAQKAWNGGDIFHGDWRGLTKEMLKPLYYLAMPVGGGQLKKTVEGLSMFDDDLPVSGSYTDSGSLRFPVEDTLGNRVQAAMFGQYASENARYYFDNDIAPLSEKQIQEYQDVDIPIKDYWKYREGLKGLTKAEEKADYINSLDLPISKKNILINNQLDRKEDVDLTDYDDYDSLAEFDFANENPEKYDFFTSIGVTYQDYANADTQGKAVYNWAFENPEKYTVSKAVTGDLFEYKQYTSDLNDIRADKDSNGKTINGSAKTKKIEYINSLNIDYGAKLILFKDLYPSDDTYNEKILEYLNGRADLDYEDRATILKELGFTVLDNGTVRWD